MRLLASLFPLTVAASCWAQPKQRTFMTDTGTVVVRYFSGGQVCTKEWRDKDDRWGRSWAYKSDGSVIAEHQTRRFAGHASVHFDYHPNGAISKAEFSTAPDAGIQWYRSTTTFDDQGNKTGFSEQGHDDRTVIPSPGTHVRRHQEERVPEREMEQVTVEEQRLFINELFVANPTNAACRAIATARHPSPALVGGSFTLAPGDTVRIGSYTMGEAWPDWKDHVDLSIHQVVLGDRYHAVPRIRTDEARVNGEHRKLYVVIEGWISAKPEPGQQHLPGLDKPEPKKKRRWLFFR